jgi:hypothetical protein
LKRTRVRLSGSSEPHGSMLNGTAVFYTEDDRLNN